MQGIVILMLMVPLLLPPGREMRRDRQTVRIRPVTTSSYASLFIDNRCAYDVTVTLMIRPQNAQVTRIVPETATCSAHSEIEAARLSPTDPNKPWRWRHDYRWTKGRMDVRHSNETRYRLPFQRGETHPVCQGYNGPLSHRGQDRYAVDFDMPEGTSICAAREGIVVDLKESWKTGGPDRKYKDQVNYVSIAHSDGTIGEYHHLKYEGGLVEIGDRVTAGQVIALSGSTGYSTLPHVHFGVYSAPDGSRRQSHRLTFVTREGTVTDPVAGKAYTAE